MTGKQQSEFGMYLVLRSFIYGVAPAIIAALPNFAIWYEKFQNLVSELFVLEEMQRQDRTGAAETKASLRELLSTFALQLSAVLMAYATVIEDFNLLNRITFTKSELDGLSNVEFIAVCKTIINAATANLVSLAIYGITDDTIKDYNVLSASFVEAMPSPQSGINEQTAATAAIKTKMKAANSLLKKLDGVVVTVKQSQADFHNKYFQARKTHTASSRNVVARGKVVDTNGVAVPLAIMSCPELNLNRKVSKKGHFIIRHAVDGVYDFTFARPGYATVVQTINIFNGTRTEVLVTMRLHTDAIAEG